MTIVFSLASRLCGKTKIKDRFLMADNIEELAQAMSQTATVNGEFYESEITSFLCIASQISDFKHSLHLTKYKDIYEQYLLIFKNFLVASIEVDREEAVLFLNDDGQIHKKETNGLSKHFVDHVIRNFSEKYKKIILERCSSSYVYRNSIIEELNRTPLNNYNNSYPKSSDDSYVLRHIKQWQDVLLLLKGRQLKAAKIAIEKWRGLPHVEAFRAAFPEEQDSNAKDYTCKAKKTAENVAQKYGLTMPNWR